MRSFLCMMRIMVDVSDEGGGCHSPGGPVSTHMFTLDSIEITKDGWRLIPSGIVLESKLHE